MRSSPASQFVGQRVCLLGDADNAAQHADHLQDLLDAALVEGEDRVAALDQIVGDLRLQIREREYEIGIERLDLLVACVQERRHLGLLPRLGRTHGVTGDADDAVAFAEQVQRLGGFFGEADDAVGDTGYPRQLLLSLSALRATEAPLREIALHANDVV